MSKKTLDGCRSGKDFVDYARKSGAEIRYGRGSHTIISTERGQVVVPLHSRDIGKGLRRKIVKMFTVLGLAAMLIGAVIVWL